MVEILKSNFQELIPVIKSSIRNASFIVVDTEFTGLDTSSENEFSLFDTLETRYKKLKSNASNFVISQLGLTTFTKCENENKYYASTYTFYLLPHQCGSNDRRFLWQASCTQFLCRHGFDFNKFVYEGIPYLNETEEEQARLEISNGSFCNHHFGSLEKRSFDPKLVEFDEHGKDGDEIVLDQDLGDHEYFQLKFLRLMYPETWTFLRDNQVIVQKVSREKRKELETVVPEEEERVLDFYIGFSHIFKVLKESKKPLIGHNLLMDMFLIYNSFYKPLPDTLSQFKRGLIELFPSIYDTKHIWLNMKKFYDVGRVTRESELHFLYHMFRNPPDDLVTLFSPTVIHTNGNRYGEIDLKHNAGYDSYVTGFVFLKLCHVFAMKKTVSLVQVVPQTFKQHMKAVKPFENKINISRAKVHYIDFCGKDEDSHRPELLYLKLKNTDQSFNIEKIAYKIAYYGYVEIQQVGPTEALVAVASFGGARNILDGLKDDTELSLVPYSFFWHSLLRKTPVWSACIGIVCISTFVLYRHLHA